MAQLRGRFMSNGLDTVCGELDGVRSRDHPRSEVIWNVTNEPSDLIRVAASSMKHWP